VKLAGKKIFVSLVSHLQLAAGSKYGWGGPVTSHSAYESFFTDENGNEMRGGERLLHDHNRSAAGGCILVCHRLRYRSRRPLAPQRG